MIATNLRNRTFLLLLLFLASVVALYFAYGRYQSLTGTKALLVQAQTESAKLVEAQNQVDKFLEEYKTLSKEQSSANTALPIKEGKPELVLAQIDRLASQSGLALGSLSVREKNNDVKIADNGIDFQDIEMEATGSYPAFKNFILLIETNLRIVDLQSITAHAEDENSIKYKLIARSYFQK